MGVSPRTVSRVVRGEGGFSAATEGRVRQAIADLGYRPNLVARSLISGRSGTIGLVGGEMADPFFPEVADGVQQAATAEGLTMFFASTDNEGERQRAALDSLMSRGVDGVLVFPAAHSDDQLRSFASQGLRIVALDHDMSADGIASLSSDIAGGARMAVEHLRDIGRRRIAYLGNAATTTARREGGYRSTIAPDADPLVEADQPTAAGGLAAMRRVLDTAPDVDAVFTYNDLMAIGAMRAITEAGRWIPDDVAVVGFDDIDVSAYLTPGLTTIELDRDRLGREAVNTLIQVIDGDSAALSTTLPVSLIRRETT